MNQLPVLPVEVLSQRVQHYKGCPSKLKVKPRKTNKKTAHKGKIKGAEKAKLCIK